MDGRYFDYEDYIEDMVQSGLPDIIGTILLIYLIIVAVAMAISFAIWLMNAVGIYRMGRAVDVPTPWLAFIPIADIYAMGKIAQTPTYGKKPMKYSILLLILYIATILSGVMGYISAVVAAFSQLAYNTDITLGMLSGVLLSFGIMLVVAIVYTVFHYIALYKIYKLFAPDNAALYLVVSILFNIATPIILFCLRNKAPQGYSKNGSGTAYNAYGGGYYQTPYQTVYPPYGGAQGVYYGQNTGAAQYTPQAYKPGDATNAAPAQNNTDAPIN